MMLIELTSIPQAALPIAALRDHLRLGSGFSDETIQDAVLESYLRAAIAAIEARTGKVLFERAFGWTITAWRAPDKQALPLAPVSTINDVIEIDAVGFETSMTPTWRLQPDDHRPYLVAMGSCLPIIMEHANVRIEMTAGFGAAWSDIPADLQQALMMLAAHFYEYRHETGMREDAMPFGVAALIERYRTVRTFLGGGV